MMNSPRIHKKIRWMALALGALVLPGCLELDTTILVEEDGSATITERLRFSQRLLDLDITGKNGSKVSHLLTRQSAQDRMKQLGTGVRLVSHKLTDVEQGAKESITVYKVNDLNNLEYCSPFLAFTDFASNNHVKFSLTPIYKGTTHQRAGELAVGMNFQKRPERVRYSEDNPAPPPPAPVAVQQLRDLQPVFRDMLQGFKIRLAIESYAPVHARRRIRGFRSKTKSMDIINVSDKNRDRFGYDILSNEEVMLDLLRRNLSSSNIEDHTKDHSSNLTLPIFYPYGAGDVWFRPSRTLFDRHFKGKMLTFAYDRTPRKTRPANWNEIGYKGDKENNGK